MSSSGESDSEKETKDTTAEGLRTATPGREMPESQPVQEETEPENQDCEKSFNPEVKSEHSDTELESCVNNGDVIRTS